MVGNTPVVSIQGQASASWYNCIDEAWRSPNVRAKFEKETGFSPLPRSGPESVVQKAAGYYQSYHDHFVIWATLDLGMLETAPSAIRSAISEDGEVSGS